MVYDPDQPQSLGEALDRFMALDLSDHQQMPQAARDSVADRTTAASADQITQAVALAIAERRGLGIQKPEDGTAAIEPKQSRVNCDAVVT